MIIKITRESKGNFLYSFSIEEYSLNMTKSPEAINEIKPKIKPKISHDSKHHKKILNEKLWENICDTHHIKKI